MNRLAVVLIASFVVTNIALGDSVIHEEKVPESTVLMSVPTLIASNAALAQFRKDQPEADLKNFFVTANEEAAYFEIVFIPRQNESKIVTKGALNEIVMDNPSGNQYGRSIGYDVSKDRYKIVKTFYSK
jgi:hypothetical protein